MSTTDLQTRGVSVPFEPQAITQQVFGGGAPSYADMYTLPYGMNITELYANIKIVAPAAQALSFKVVIGKVNSDYTPNYNLTDAEIARSHLLISGQTAKFTVAAGATLFLDGLNLKRSLSPNAISDAFCFYILYDVAPDFSSSGSFEQHLYGSAVLGVL